MTAQPSGHVMWSPDPLRQRLADYTVEDVLSLPDDAPRVELRDGVMITVPYDLDDGRYELAGDSATELVLSAPFEMKLPIRDITP